MFSGVVPYLVHRQHQNLLSRSEADVESASKLLSMNYISTHNCVPASALGIQILCCTECTVRDPARLAAKVERRTIRFFLIASTIRIGNVHTEWPKKMYTLFTHQYLWNKFKRNFYFRARV